MTGPTGQNTERRFDASAWRVLMSVWALVGLVLMTTVAVLAQPGDGWQMPFNTSPPELGRFYGDWPTPLQAGDQVLAINGVDVTATYLDYSINSGAWREGATATYSIVRAGRPLDVPVVLHRLSLPAILRGLAGTATQDVFEWSWGLIALFVFWRRPRSLAARLLLVAMVPHNVITKVGWAATTAGAVFAPAGLRLVHDLSDNFWSWLFWPTVIWLLQSFPQRVFPLTRWPRLVPLLLYALPLAALLISLTTGSEIPVAVALVTELLALLAALVMAGLSAYGRRANPTVRAQANWVLLGFGLSQGLVLAAYLLDLVWPFVDRLPAWTLAPITLALPICLGIAITRYRLFELDVIIRRTLVYAVLTAVLAFVYFGSVVVLQSLLRSVTGGESPLVIVISTLLIAALFAPVRARVQRLIDRRFYRRKYNAARTLARFGSQARTETDLGRLSGQLQQTVQDAMQPASVSLWLRPPDPVKGHDPVGHTRITIAP